MAPDCRLVKWSDLTFFAIDITDSAKNCEIRPILLQPPSAQLGVDAARRRRAFKIYGECQSV